MNFKNQNVKTQKRHQNRRPHNAISIHVNNTGHNIKWDESEILVLEDNLQRRRLREAILIHNTPNINTDTGVYLNPTGSSFLWDNAPVM